MKETVAPKPRRGAGHFGAAGRTCSPPTKCERRKPHRRKLGEAQPV